TTSEERAARLGVLEASVDQDFSDVRRLCKRLQGAILHSKADHAARCQLLLQK
ncbi:hypothetical protein A2U01_0058986, partial [Trifolium medium]|nr:hypothetical protein [Trifolium medium]